MIASTLTWHGDAVMEEVKATSWDRMRTAAHYLWDRVQDALNTSFPPASVPDSPPHKRTSWLQRHVLEEYDARNFTARVGLGRNALYGLFLELGTKRMKARPWLLATLKKYLQQIKALAGG